MTSNFRYIFYENYVSGFKNWDIDVLSNSLPSYFKWLKHKYLPLLVDLGYESDILELGCGAGFVIEFLKENGFTKVRGIDLSAEQVEQAKLRGNDVEIADVFDYLEGKDFVFDVIIALDFIEHFSKDELIPLVQLIFKSLKKNGKLILQTPNGEGLFPSQNIYGDLTHLTIFTPSSLRQLLTAHSGEFVQ